jgi:hypothetical protein
VVAAVALVAVLVQVLLPVRLVVVRVPRARVLVLR